MIALVNDWIPLIHQGKNLGNVGFPMIALVNPLVNDWDYTQIIEYQPKSTGGKQK